MTIECPVCHGNGKALRGNGVDPQKSNELKTCWMCKGIGQVVEVRHDKKLQITKYWQVGSSV